MMRCEISYSIVVSYSRKQNKILPGKLVVLALFFKLMLPSCLSGQCRKTVWCVYFCFNRSYFDFASFCWGISAGNCKQSKDMYMLCFSQQGIGSGFRL